MFNSLYFLYGVFANNTTVTLLRVYRRCKLTWTFLHEKIRRVNMTAVLASPASWLKRVTHRGHLCCLFVRLSSVCWAAEAGSVCVSWNSRMF